jgi:hypothetical protein
VWESNLNAASKRASKSASVVAACSSAYARLGQPCVFKVTEQSTPHDLDSALAARDYRRDAETLVCTQSLIEQVEGPSSVELLKAAEGPWMNTWSRLSERPPDGGVFGRLIAATPTPATYALIQHEGVGIACARATLSGGLVGLYDLMVAPEHRRQGLGDGSDPGTVVVGPVDGCRTGLRADDGWQSAGTGPAGGMGFSEVYRYWYRIQH